MVDRNAASVSTLPWNTGDAVISEAKLSLAFLFCCWGFFCNTSTEYNTGMLAQFGMFKSCSRLPEINSCLN